MESTILWTVFLIVSSQIWPSSPQTVPPRSPCPKIFRYEADAFDGGSWYGVVEAPNSFGPRLDVALRMALPAALQNSYYGRLEVLDSEKPQLQAKLRAGAPIKYRVDFPLPRPLPHLTSVVFNGQEICSGRAPAGGFMTTINLQHTLQTGNGGSYRPFEASSDYDQDEGGQSYEVTTRRVKTKKPKRPYNNVYQGNEDVVNSGPIVQRPYVVPNDQQNYGEQDLSYDSNVGTSTQRPYNPNANQNYQPNVQQPEYSTQRPYNPNANQNYQMNPNVQQPERPYSSDSNQNYQPNPVTTQRPYNPNPNQNYQQDPVPSNSQGPTQNNYQQNPVQRPESTTQRPYQPNQNSQYNQSPNQNTQQSPSRLSTSDICGTRQDSPVALIVNGERPERNEWPWLAALFKKKSGALEFVCGSSLVSERLVVTAAHCVTDDSRRDMSAEKLLLRLGAYNVDDWADANAVTRTVARVRTKDFFKEYTFANDIAVLVMSQPVAFGEYVRPVCLWSGSDDQAAVVGLEGTVVGWGRDEDGARVTAEPKRVRVPIVSTTECRGSNPSFFQLTSNTTLCAGSKSGTGPCTGDSGGGLYVEVGGRWYIRGIVSNALKSAQNGCDLYQYVVYTDCAKYVGWINGICATSECDT